jgi:hypothetical protein
MPDPNPDPHVFTTANAVVAALAAEHLSPSQAAEVCALALGHVCGMFDLDLAPRTEIARAAHDAAKAGKN